MATMWLHTMDEVGMTPLTRASKSGRFEVANAMLLREAIDDPKNFRELPELHRAACWGFSDVIDELLSDGANVFDIDAIGETALHKAVRLGNYDAARTLIDNGADVNQRDAMGFTALHWAALIGSADMAELLMVNYADVHARDYIAGGITPLGIAKLMGYTNVTSVLKNKVAML